MKKAFNPLELNEKTDKSIKTTSISNNNLILLYLTAIDNKDEILISFLYNKNNNHNFKCKRDIVYEIYNNYGLNPKQLQFIIENCNSYLKISSSLIKKLMKDNNLKLLEILFNHFKFFDNTFIIKLLYFYKNKTQITNSELYPLINDDKYKVSTVLYNGLNPVNSSFYLINACKSGNRTSVEFFIKHGANVNVKKYDGETPLYIACKKGYVTIVKYLVEHGANINEKKEDYTPIFFAYLEGHEAIVKYLAEHKADLNKGSTYYVNRLFTLHHVPAKDTKSMINLMDKDITPLFIACQKGDEKMVKLLVKYGANINKRIFEGITSILIACENGHYNIVKYLVECGVNLYITDKLILHTEDYDFIRFNKIKDYLYESKSYISSLIFACENGNIDMLNYLVEHGAVINQGFINNSDLLFFACKKDYEEIVKYLMRYGVNINRIDNNGVTPLHLACQNGNVTLVKYFVEHGANINSENNEGENPLIYACKKGHEEIVKYLIGKEANIEKEYFNKKNPLYVACQYGHIGIVKYLVEEQGASINRVDDNVVDSPITPLYVACMNGYIDIVKYLVEHGADINEGNENGETPLYVACNRGHMDIEKYLVLKHRARLFKENNFESKKENDNEERNIETLDNNDLDDNSDIEDIFMNDSDNEFNEDDLLDSDNDNEFNENDFLDSDSDNEFNEND